MTAPIALFVYNRPGHTRRTVESLLSNDLAADSDLYVFSDAARDATAATAVQAVRDYVASIGGFRSVRTTYQETNQGLAKSIISGTSQLCREFGQVIVLEDDLVSSPYFLRYMNDALELYRDVAQVMHVSGSAYPIDTAGLSETYFLQIPLCWGWATWQRAWQHFDKDIAVMDRFDRRAIDRFCVDGTFPDFWAQLIGNRDGSINTWFIFWYAEIFLRGGLSLFPRESLLRNIGMDGTGVHSGTTTKFDATLSATPIRVERLRLSQSSGAFERHKTYFTRIGPSAIARLNRKVRSMVRRAIS